MPALVANGKPTIPSKVHRQQPGHQHHPAKNAADESLIKPSFQMRVCFNWRCKGQQTHGHGKAAGNQQREGENLPPARVINAALAPDHGHPKSDCANAARHNMGGNQRMEQEQDHPSLPSI